MNNERMTITLKNPNTGDEQVRNPRRKKRRIYGILMLLLLGVVLLAVLIAAFVWIRGMVASNTMQTISTNGQNTASGGDQSQEIISRVSALMLLPDETPTVAIVSDLSKLQGQRFFANASKGDVVLMYPKAQKAILYSPTQNKIIEVAPITNDTQ